MWRVVRHVEEKRLAEFNRLTNIPDGIFGDEFGEVFAVSVNLFAVFPEIVCLVNASLSQTPVEDVRKEVDTARHESEPIVEPVVFRT